MSRFCVQSLGLFALFVGVHAGSVGFADNPDAPRIGRRVANFTLDDIHGKTVSLDDFADHKLVVLAFLGNECPLARLYAPRLADLAREFEPLGVAFIGINANLQDSIEEIADYAQVHGVPFPMLKDKGNKLADQIGALRTPETFLLDEKRTVRYWGRIDNQYSIGVQRPAATRHDLAEAIKELLAGEPVSVPTTPVPGCHIGRVPRSDGDRLVTWNGHVSPIFREHCQFCHTDDGPAPFSLTTYDEVVGWSAMIREVVSQGRMPPWHASDKYGEFINDNRLTADEKELLFKWVTNGSPEGEPSEAAVAEESPQEPRFGEPDRVIYMNDEPFVVPSTGVIDYQYYVVDPGFTEDVWVEAARCRPGCPQVVHHMTTYLLPAQAGDDFGRIDLRDHILVGYAPGNQLLTFPKGSALRIPKGAKILFMMHYTPYGIPYRDRSYLELIFADQERVEKRVETALAANLGFHIPPHAHDHPVASSFHFRQDALLFALTPHMHYRGKSFRYEVEYPDGNREILLDVENYDFNWQTTYALRKPKHLPAGSTIHCKAVYDNSADNPANPDPDQLVRWGLQSSDEMMDGYIHVVVDKDQPPLGEAPGYRAAVVWFSLIGGIGVLMASVVVPKWRRAQQRSRGTISTADVVRLERDSIALPDTGAHPGIATDSGAASFGRVFLGVLAVCALPILLLADTAVAALMGWSPAFDRLAQLAVVASSLAILAVFASLLIKPCRRFLANNVPRLALASGAILVGCLLAEGAVAMLAPTAPFHARKPNAEYRFTPNPGFLPGVSSPARYTTNSDGLRSLPADGADAPMRLLAIGGGSVEGLYLDDRKTWPYVLGEKLSEQTAQAVSVEAAGISDYCSGHHRRLIESSPAVSRADCVIIQLGATDLVRWLMRRDMGESWPPLWYRSHTTSLFQELWNVHLGKGPVVDETGEHFVGMIRRFVPLNPRIDERDLSAALDEYGRRIRAIRRAAQDRGVNRLVFTTQPVLWNSAMEPEAVRRYWVAHYVPTRSGWKYLAAANLRGVMDRYNERLLDECRQMGIECIDLSGMSGDIRYFYDDYHPNDAGAREMATRIADWFADHPAPEMQGKH